MRRFAQRADRASAGVPEQADQDHRAVSAGGTSDILARAIGQKLTDSLGQTIVVENKPGANGNLGADFVSKSAPDGYTLLLADMGALAISPSLYSLLRPDHRFFSGDDGGVLAAHPCCPSFGAGEQCKRIGYARQVKAWQVEFCGVQRWQRAASGRHRIRVACRYRWAYIPYKGGAQAITDMAGGQADVMFNGMLATYPHVKSGKLKILAVSSSKRMSAIPDVPTVAEAAGLDGFQTGSWQGVLAPPNTPKEVVARLSTEITKILNTPEMKERLAVQGAEVSTNTPEQLSTFIRDEKSRWAQVVKAANLKLE